MTVEITISEEQLKKLKLFVGVPMYGGNCHGSFAQNIADLSTLCTKLNIELKLFYLFNESLITRARNYLADDFMRSNCTHLIFIDADISFNPQDVIAMAAICNEDGKEIVCGPYPKKTISWEKIKTAVDKGYADENPEQLERFVGDYVFNPVGNGEVALDSPAEVLESGTGFMCIRRSALEKFRDAYPEFMFRPDHVRTKHFDGSREVMMYFQAMIDNKHARINFELEEWLKLNPNASHDDIIKFVKDTRNSYRGKQFSNRYLSEDYMFCQWARKIGIKTWLCPWMELKHTGTYTFGGSLVDLAQIGAHATADPTKIKKS